MRIDYKGFGAVGVVFIIVVLTIAAFVGWKIFNSNESLVTNNNNSNAKVPTDQNIHTDEPEITKAPRLSDTWLLRESAEASIRVPDGFNFLAKDDEPISFSLPNDSQDTLRYEQGKIAKDVGENHKHFSLGLLVSYNSQGLNPLGNYLREFETYSGLPVKVDLFEYHYTEGNPSTFKDNSKNLKYTVTNGDKYISIDYMFLGEGIIPIVDEMVKTINIK